MTYRSLPREDSFNASSTHSRFRVYILPHFNSETDTLDMQTLRSPDSTLLPAYSRMGGPACDTPRFWWGAHQYWYAIHECAEYRRGLFHCG